MKKFSVFAALMSLLMLAGCGKSNSESVAPTILWESNSRFSVMEIGTNMDAVVSAQVPEGLSVLTVTATIPTKLVGLAEQYISISANKSSDKLVFDFIKDSKCANSLRNFTSVAAGAKSFKMDFAKLLDAVIGTAEVPNGSSFVFKVHVEDNAGNVKECSCSFKWTAGPSFTITGKDTYELVKGSTEKLIVDIAVPGKVESLTVSFGGSKASPEALAYVKQRTSDGTAVLDLVKDAAGAKALGFTAVADGATSAKLDFASTLEDLNYNVTSASTTEVVIKVVDKLGKSAEQKLSLVKK